MESKPSGNLWESINWIIGEPESRNLSIIVGYNEMIGVFDHGTLPGPLAKPMETTIGPDGR
jgi:hypothetical protein